MQNQSHPDARNILREKFKLYENYSFIETVTVSPQRSLHSFLHNKKIYFYLQEREFDDVHNFYFNDDINESNCDKYFKVYKSKVVFYHFTQIPKHEVALSKEDEIEFLENMKYFRTKQNYRGFLQFSILLKNICENVYNLNEVSQDCLISKLQATHLFCGKIFNLLIYRKLIFATQKYEEFSFVMHLDDQLISFGEQLDAQTSYDFLEELRLFLIYNEVTNFVTVKKLNSEPLKLKELLQNEEIKETEIDFDKYCQAPCVMTFPISGTKSRHFALYIGKNEIYHINAISDSSTALGKIKASVLCSKFVNFSAVNVIDYLRQSGKSVMDIEIIKFFLCPFSLPEIIFRADQQYSERNAEYNLIRKNCEHYVNKIVFGVSRSLQVDYFVSSWRLKKTKLTASKTGNLIYKLGNKRCEINDDEEAIKIVSSISYKVKH